MPNPVSGKLWAWEWIVLIPLIVLTSPIWLTYGLITSLRNRRERWFPPDEGEDGLGCPAGLDPRPPSLAYRHAEKWPSEFEAD